MEAGEKMITIESMEVVHDFWGLHKVLFLNKSWKFKIYLTILSHHYMWYDIYNICNTFFNAYQIIFPPTYGCLFRIIHFNECHKSIGCLILFCSSIGHKISYETYRSEIIDKENYNEYIIRNKVFPFVTCQHIFICIW